MIAEYFASFSFKVVVRPNIAFFGSSKMIPNILSNSTVVSLRRWDFVRYDHIGISNQVKFVYDTLISAHSDFFDIFRSP
jgi:hypothetical protein